MTTVYYQGDKGCFSEMAAEKFFGQIQGKGVYSFENVFQSVEEKKKSYGIIPIENTLTGSIHQNYDLLLKYDLFIVGEVKLKISFELMADATAKPESIREIWSHPVALDQCRIFLNRHPQWKVVPVYDTAGAARMLKEGKRKDVGVIAGPQVSSLYSLSVLDEKIEDNPENFTRFFLLSSSSTTGRDEALKTSYVFRVKNIPGILFKCLSIFALRNIDLVKLESRPVIGNPWEYMFYVDFQGSADDENCAGAIETLREFVVYMKWLGSYVYRS